jgi:hypothetical protein
MTWFVEPTIIPSLNGSVSNQEEQRYGFRGIGRISNP